jgi:hypothetical protein
MTVRDLHAGPPRRWSEEIGGICWLPRLIDKTRAALAGTLGDYLFGQSPVDRGLLRALGMSHRDFASIVRDAPGDDAVLAAIAARDQQAPARARAWSVAMPARSRLFLWLLDVDDGYCATPFGAPIKFGANVISRTVKRLWPSRAAEPAAVADATSR